MWLLSSELVALSVPRGWLNFSLCLACRSPVNPGQYIVKRIIALEGDVVSKALFRLTFPSNVRPTSQVQTLPPYPDTEVVIPKGQAWIEGNLCYQFATISYR